MYTEHSVLAPSSASRRVACPGSRALEALYPETEDSEYAREGHLAHEIASTSLLIALQKFHGIHNFTEDFSLGYSAEMLSGADMYVCEIMSTLKKLKTSFLKFSVSETSFNLEIEQRIGISNIHELCWGTPDCFLTETRCGTLFIWDYKFGHGFVEVMENWQMIEYAAGIIENKLGCKQSLIQRVEFCIIQPRSYHKDGPIRKWEIFVEDLKPYFDKLREAESLAMSPNAPLNPNSECDYCLARHACPALQKSALTAVDISTSNTPNNLPPSSLGNELRYLKRAAELLDARITGLEQEAAALLMRGERIPFFRLESSTGRKRWVKPAEEIISLGQLFGLDLSKPAEVITPKQAADAGIPIEIVQEYSETPRGALKLVPETTLDVRKMFNKN